MAITPVGNLTYINQNTNANLANQARADMTPLHLSEHANKLKEIEETRTPEQTKEVDKDAKERKNAFQQRKNPEQKAKQERALPPPEGRILDVLA